MNDNLIRTEMKTNYILHNLITNFNRNVNLYATFTVYLHYAINEQDIALNQCSVYLSMISNKDLHLS